MEKKHRSSRKHFLSRGLGFVALLAAASIPLLSRNEPKKKGKMVKMLSQDGQLVEVDESLLPSRRKMISNAELKKWVTKK